MTIKNVIHFKIPVTVTKMHDKKHTNIKTLLACNQSDTCNVKSNEKNQSDDVP